MKVIVDQNISFRIIPSLNGLFEDIKHIKDVNLVNADDFEIYMFARVNGFDAILTLDEDFYNLQLTHGIPPKVVWLRTGNCSTSILTAIIHKHIKDIYNFYGNDDLDCLEIFS